MLLCPPVDTGVRKIFLPLPFAAPVGMTGDAVNDAPAPGKAGPGIAAVWTPTPHETVFFKAAWAAASLAMGTRNGEQLT